MHQFMKRFTIEYTHDKVKVVVVVVVVEVEGIWTFKQMYLRILGYYSYSVAEQIGRAFDNPASGHPGDVALKYAREVLNETSVLFDGLPTNSRISLENFRVYGETRSCLFASGPVRGGGYIGMWRVVKLLSTGRKDGPTCNSHAGGWNDKQYKQMVEQEFHPPKMTNETITIGKYDAVVLRIQL